ncbi:MAG: hypothetical protein ABI790_01640 [Betaproteobacteria bacterium]
MESSSTRHHAQANFPAKISPRIGFMGGCRYNNGLVANGCTRVKNALVSRPMNRQVLQGLSWKSRGLFGEKQVAEK